MWSYWPARWSYFSDTLGLNVRADGAHVPIFTSLGRHMKRSVDGKIKYTNFGHEKYTTLRHKNWAALATKGTTFATKYTA